MVKKIHVFISILGGINIGLTLVGGPLLDTVKAGDKVSNYYLINVKKRAKGRLLMKNDIRTMIGTHEVIQSLVYDWVDVKEIRLPQGYGMVFLTDALLDDIAELTEPSDRLYEPELIAFAERSDFTAETACFLRQYSFRTALAYVEMDYSGGICTQRGVCMKTGVFLSHPWRAKAPSICC